MDKKTIQVTITGLSLVQRGPMDGAEDTNIFRFSISYPAEGIPGIETVKTVKANKSIPDNWDEDFDKSIVFKTPLRGKAKLKVEAASVDKDSDGEKFLKGLFKSVFKGVLGVWTGGFGSAYAGAITNSVGTSLVDLIEENDDIDIVGAASFMLDSENLVTELSSPLKVKKPVVKKEIVQTSGPPSRRRRRVTETIVIPTGENGSVSLKVEVINE